MAEIATPPSSRRFGNVGDALMGSALTTILGLGAMYFADFGKFRNSGPTIGLCLAVALVASLTLAPAMLRALGKLAYWPAKIRVRDGRNCDDEPYGVLDRIWDLIARVIVARPGLILVGSILLLSPAAWYGRNVPVSYDLISDLPRNSRSVVGTQLLRRHFPPGETGPLTVLAVRRDGGFDTREADETYIAMATKYFYDLPGVVSVRSLAEPLGGQPGNWNVFGGEGLRKAVARAHPLTTARFLTQDESLKGKVARFDLVLDADPFSKQATSFYRDLQQRLRSGEAAAPRSVLGERRI